MDTKTSKYIPKTIYLDSENIEKLDEIVEYTGLNPSQIFRRVLANINKEELETKEEKFKRLSKSGNGKLMEKPSDLEDVHMEDFFGAIKDAKHTNTVKLTRQVKKGERS